MLIISISVYILQLDVAKIMFQLLDQKNLVLPRSELRFPSCVPFES